MNPVYLISPNCHQLILTHFVFGKQRFQSVFCKKLLQEAFTVKEKDEKNNRRSIHLYEKVSKATILCPQFYLNHDNSRGMWKVRWEKEKVTTFDTEITRELSVLNTTFSVFQSSPSESDGNCDLHKVICNCVCVF